MKFNFKNNTILITGATRGIGKQIAIDLELLGVRLLLTGTNKKEINRLNKKVKLEKSSKKYFHLDILDNYSVSKFLLDIEKIDEIHGLINNAGINRLNSIQDSKIKDWDEMLNVNLSTPYKLIKIISKKMINNNFGRIINIGSIFSKISKERRAIYSVTKFGIHGLTVGVSNDLAKYNILINTLSPGFILTELTQKNLSQKEMNKLKDIIPIKRLGTKREVSNVAIFLLSDLNLYLTGQNIIIDGGYTNI